MKFKSFLEKTLSNYKRVHLKDIMGKACVSSSTLKQEEISQSGLEENNRANLNKYKLGLLEVAGIKEGEF